MKIVKVEDIKSTDREVICPNGGFVSNRILLKSDGMGFGLNKTVIPPNGKQHWHYKSHLESCFCVSGYRWFYPVLIHMTQLRVGSHRWPRSGISWLQ